MKNGSKSLWWLVATVLAACLLGLGYKHLNRQSRRDNENPYKYDIEEYKGSGAGTADYSEVETIELEQASLSALAVDMDDNILLAADDKIHIHGRNGAPLSEISIGGTANCIAVSENGTIYAGVQDHIELYSPEGEAIQSWTSLGENCLITSLALVDGNLYAADYGNRLVWRYDLDGSLLGNIEGMHPDGKTIGFVAPSPYFDVAAAAGGNLWIANPGKLAVQLYRPDGELLRSWGEAAMEIKGFCGCCNPAHIASMDDGGIVTAEKGLPRVKIYDADGELDAVVATANDFRGPVRGGEGKPRIQDIAVNSRGEILVLDCKAKEIRIYERRK